MIFITQLSIGFFALLVLAIIFFDNRRHKYYARSDQLFSWLVLAAIGVILSSIFAWLPEGSTAEFSRTALWLLNAVYLTASAFLLYLWPMYISLKLLPEKSRLRNPVNALILAIPAIFVLILSVSAPMNRLLFFVDRANHYQRGVLYTVPYFTDLFYIIVSVIIALAARHRVTTADERSNCLIFALFAPLPVLGILLQMLNAGLWLAFPFAALAVLIIYIKIQNQRLTVDQLTGLSNNTELERSVNDALRRGDSCCLIVADIDNFQRINENYGHSVGDEALRRTADLFRETFSDNRACLARCGGDEFMMLTPCSNEAHANQLVDQLRRAVERSARNSTFPCELTLSIGYACCDKRYKGDFAQLTNDADRRMYREKQYKASHDDAPASAE